MKQRKKTTWIGPLLRFWRRGALLLLLAVELLVVAFAMAAAAKPAVQYSFAPADYQDIATDAEIAYDEDGRRGVTEFATEGQDILQTPAMALVPGHYLVAVDYAYDPTMIEGGKLHNSSLRFTAAETDKVSGETALLDKNKTAATVTLNVMAADDTIRLVFRDDGGTFTIGNVTVTQDMAYARAVVWGWLVLFLLLDAALTLLLPGSPLRLEAGLCTQIWVIAAVTALVCAPVLMDGVGTRGSDWLYHLQRIEGIAQGLAQGQFPVRINTAAKDGYGYANSLFYGELFLYFPALLRLAGMSLQGAFRVFFLAANFMTGMLATFSFGAIFRRRRVALLGGVLYLLAAYRVFDLYWRAAVGEYLAMAFLPVLAAALWRLYADPSPKAPPKHGCALLVVAFTGLLQSNMLATELGAIWALLAAVWNWRTTLRRPVLLTWCRAAGLTVLLNLWFLLPFATTMATGNYSEINDGQGIQSKGHTLADLLFQSDSFCTIGLPLLLGAAALVACLLYFGDKIPRATARLGWAGLAVGCLGAVLCTKLFPWDALGALPGVGVLFRVIQFPGRNFMVATIGLLVAALCAVAALEQLGRRQAAMGLAGLYTATALLCFSAFMTNYMQGIEPTYLGDTSAILYGDKYSSNMTLALDRLYNPTAAAETLDGFERQAQISTVTVESTWQEGGVTYATVNAGTTAEEQEYLELPLLYYPGYRELNDQGQVFMTVNGLVGVELPAGYTGTVAVALREAKRWLVGDIISLLTALALLVGWGAKYLRRGFKALPRHRCRS